VNQRLVGSVVTVTDDALVDAMRFLFEHLHLVTEPRGVAGVAALLTGAVEVDAGERIGVIVSGGNVGLDRFTALMANGA
jgi:threonine dehydratase